MKQAPISSAATTGQRIAPSYRAAFAAALRAPATWFGVLLVLLATLYLVVTSSIGALLIALGAAVGTGLLVLLTIPLTPDVAPSPWVGVSRSRWRGWLQLGLVLLLVLLVYQALLASFGLLPPSLTTVPLWTGFLNAVYQAQASLGIPANYLLVPLIYFVLPFAALLLLGARPGELGFARGYHAWRIAALWSVLPLALILIAFAQGHWTSRARKRRRACADLHIERNRAISSHPYQLLKVCAERRSDRTHIVGDARTARGGLVTNRTQRNGHRILRRVPCGFASLNLLACLVVFTRRVHASCSRVASLSSACGKST